MVFSSYVFIFIFLPSLIVLYFLVPSRYKALRNLVLLAFSFVFYAWNVPKYLLILLGSVAINWFFALMIDVCNHNAAKKKKLLLGIAVILNIGMLGYYKYADFVMENINRVFHQNLPLANVVLPIGISFYTFQGMSYVIDVYRGDGKVQKNPLNVALYIVLFPQLVAGPIVRYQTISEQISSRRETLEQVYSGVQRFIVGLSKKVLIADTFGAMADNIFGLANVTGGEAWIGALAYTLQIFFDFSGYSDMAIGLGKIFGFDFEENFNYPYISSSVTEFWRRWHISLSTWFRDYVYIPLGGNRVGVARHIFNMFAVWTLTGIWHGANWTFVVWGVYYFVWLFLEKYVFVKIQIKLPKILKWFATMLIVVVGWVIFRADSISAALDYLKVMFSFRFEQESLYLLLRYFKNYIVFWVIAILCSTPAVKIAVESVSNKWNKNIVDIVYSGITFLLLMVSCCFIIAGSYNAFIYFQF